MFDNMCIRIDDASHEYSPMGLMSAKVFRDLLHGKKWVPRQLISAAMGVNTSLDNFEAVIAEHGGCLARQEVGRRKKGRDN